MDIIREHPYAVVAVAAIGAGVGATMIMKRRWRFPQNSEVHKRADYSSQALWFRPEAQQQGKPADCFFLHPTTVLAPTSWNCPRDGYGPKDNKTIPDVFNAPDLLENSAGAFTHMCNLWAPRYSQMGFLTLLVPGTDMTQQQQAASQKAIDVALADAKDSFEYFLANRPDKSKPFIIAAHSQGSMLMARVIKDCVDDTVHQKHFVAAYLTGGYVDLEILEGMKQVKACAGPTDKGCMISWDTRVLGNWEPSGLQEGALAMYPSTMCWMMFDKAWAEPKGKDTKEGRLEINPMTWTHANGGTFLGAKVGGSPDPAMPPADSGWASDKTQVDGNAVLIERAEWWKQEPSGPAKHGNYHPADCQFWFWNIRQNVTARLKASYPSEMAGWPKDSDSDTLQQL